MFEELKISLYIQTFENCILLFTFSPPFEILAGITNQNQSFYFLILQWKSQEDLL